MKMSVLQCTRLLLSLLRLFCLVQTLREYICIARVWCYDLLVKTAGFWWHLLVMMQIIELDVRLFQDHHLRWLSGEQKDTFSIWQIFHVGPPNQKFAHEWFLQTLNSRKLMSKCSANFSCCLEAAQRTIDLQGLCINNHIFFIYLLQGKTKRLCLKCA